MSGKNNLESADSISSPEKSLFNPLQSCLCPDHHIDNEILNITDDQLMIKPSDLFLPYLIKITVITIDWVMLRMCVLKKTQEDICLL